MRRAATRLLVAHLLALVLVCGANARALTLRAASRQDAANATSPGTNSNSSAPGDSTAASAATSDNADLGESLDSSNADTGPLPPGASQGAPEGFDIVSCDALGKISARSDGFTLEARKSMLILLYFAGLASLAFGSVALVRAHVLGARTQHVIRACAIFGGALVFVPALMLLMRTLLVPYDALYLGVTRATFSQAKDYCKSQDKWPVTVDESGAVTQVSGGTPYLGEPPRDAWPFWLLLGGCCVGALALLATLVRVRVEERMSAHLQKRGAADSDGTRSVSVYQCDCAPEECVHT